MIFNHTNSQQITSDLYCPTKAAKQRNNTIKTHKTIKDVKSAAAMHLIQNKIKENSKKKYKDKENKVLRGHF